MHLKSGLLTPNIANLTDCRSHENNDMIYFRNSDVGVITTQFKDIHENGDVKIDDALTEWDMIQFNIYGRQF